MVRAAAQQTVCLQTAPRACPRPSAAQPAPADRGQLAAARPPAPRRPAALAAAHRSAARLRHVHAAAAAAPAMVMNFKVAIFSAQSFVEDFMKEPLEKAFAEENLKVRRAATGPWPGCASRWNAPGSADPCRQPTGM